jgi:hypothetical protein
MLVGERRDEIEQQNRAGEGGGGGFQTHNPKGHISSIVNSA